MARICDLSWWIWLAMVVLLGAGLGGYPNALHGAVALGLWQSVHFAYRQKNVTAFPVQVRVAYLGLLLLGQWPPLYWIYWVQLAGTTAMVTVGYCPLARLLSLMPWNRQVPFTLRLLWRTVVTPPVAGSIVHDMPAD